MNAPSKPTSSTTSRVSRKSASVSPGKPDDDVGREREVGDRRPQVIDEPQVAVARVRAAHRLEDSAGAGLKRQVRVLADRGALRHRSDDVPAKVLRMRAREADPLDARDRVDGAQELGEARADVTPVGVDVLSEQRHLADASFGKPCHLRQDLAGTARDLAAADCRDDAVGADRVAAHRDLHPCLETPLAAHRKLRCEGALVGGAERSAGDSLPACSEPVTEMRDGAGAEGDVDVRIEREQPLPLSLGVAAADGDHRAGPLTLQLRRVAHVGREARVRLLADRARVEDEDVRLVLRRRLAEA